MNDKKYLKWYNKVGYGSGDIAGNVVYALLSVFVMIYLTDTAGLNAGVIGTLMMLARIFDGLSDIFFGTLIEPFSPGGPLDWRGSARWCGKDWVGWGWCARGPVRDSVF